jgi:predicted nucleotidyltransferase
VILNTDHLKRCIDTLESSLVFYSQAEPDSIAQAVFRNAIVKGYELALETLTLLPGFVTDATTLEARLRAQFDAQLLRAHVPRTEVWVYGSRVSGGGHDASDLDLVLRNRHGLHEETAALPALRDTFIESNLPIRVDVMDWARIPVHFRHEIKRACRCLDRMRRYGKSPSRRAVSRRGDTSSMAD